MLVLPILLGLFLARRLGVPWRLYFIGAATFIGSQVVHLPMNAGLDRLFDAGVLPTPPEGYQLIVSAILLGFTAGLCEEGARYVVYRWWIKSVRSWREALMFGAGHGGVEAIIIGGLVALGTINIVVLSNTDLTTLQLTPDQLAELEQQMAAALSVPWFAPLLGALERVFAMTFHLSAAVMVLQVFRRRNILWLVAAMLWHTFLNAMAVYVNGTAGPYWAEAALLVTALISLAIIWALRGGEPFAPLAGDGPPQEPLSEPQAPSIEPPKVTAEALDKTRYQ
jgi:uncharacterized membrane protein YhfC